MLSTKKFQLIEHTADIGLRAYGNDLKEAYANAAYGLFSIITDLRKVRKIESRIIDIHDNNLEDLLYSWLNELLFYFDAEKILFKQCDIQEFNDKTIKAICYGEVADPSRHEIKTGVKAATYHKLKVDTEKNELEVIFDI